MHPSKSLTNIRITFHPGHVIPMIFHGFAPSIFPSVELSLAMGLSWSSFDEQLEQAALQEAELAVDARKAAVFILGDGSKLIV